MTENTAEEQDPTLRYFKEYRRQMQLLADINAEYDRKRREHKEELSRLEETSRRLNHKINSMQQIMTKMINEGCDPTMAKLKMEEHDSDNMWRDASDPFRESMRISDRGDISFGSMSSAQIASLTGGLTGATGAIGAVGSVGYPGDWGIGANGGVDPGIPDTYGSITISNGGYQSGYGATPPTTRSTDDVPF